MQVAPFASSSVLLPLPPSRPLQRGPPAPSPSPPYHASSELQPGTQTSCQEPRDQLLMPAVVVTVARVEWSCWEAVATVGGVGPNVRGQREGVESYGRPSLWSSCCLHEVRH